jgi:hypothetical protein
LVLGLIIFFGYQYIYQDHRIIENEKPDYIVTSDAIFQNFFDDQNQSESNYLDKTIEINGLVTEVNSNDLTLDDKIFCKFLNPVTTINVNDTIKIKGRCIGFDDLLEQVKLDQCNIIK